MTKERYEELIALEENGKSINQEKKEIFTTTGGKVYYFVPKGTTIHQFCPTNGSGFWMKLDETTNRPIYIETLSSDELYLRFDPNGTRGVLKEDCRKVTAQEYQNAQAWMTATENGMKSCQHDLQEGTLKKTLHDFFFETRPHKLGAQEEHPKTSSLLIIAACIAVIIFVIRKAKK